ncbi:MAG: hypothetical protein N2037_01170 [Acidimicrobiales bacterium]|nr:hypothetical protein [Acidimicrobiales bacterium]
MTEESRPLLDELRLAADFVAHALRVSGYRADWSPASLWDLERFFCEHVAEGAPRPGGLLAVDTGKRVFALGSYLGEVVRRDLAGEWIVDELDDHPEVSAAIQFPDGTRTWPVQQVMRRIVNGRRDGIVQYAVALGVEVGPLPGDARRWWSRWRRKR